MLTHCDICAPYVYLNSGKDYVYPSSKKDKHQGDCRATWYDYLLCFHIGMV